MKDSVYLHIEDQKKRLFKLNGVTFSESNEAQNVLLNKPRKIVYQILSLCWLIKLEENYQKKNFVADLEI